MSLQSPQKLRTRTGEPEESRAGGRVLSMWAPGKGGRGGSLGQEIAQTPAGKIS